MPACWRSPTSPCAGRRWADVADAAVYVALDAASFLLSGLVAAFFARTHRLRPDESYGALAIAFATLAVAHLATAASGERLFPGSTAVDALRTLGVFLASVLIATAYALRSRRVPARTMPILACHAAIARSCGLRRIACCSRAIVWSTSPARNLHQPSHP